MISSLFVGRDLDVDLLRKRGVVTTHGPDLAGGQAKLLSRLGRPTLQPAPQAFQQDDDLPHVWTARQRRPPSRGTVAEHDPRVGLHAQAFVDKSLSHPRYRRDVATHPVEFEDDFAALVARTRREMTAAGEHKAPVAGLYEPPFGTDAREAIMALVRDGTYREAARRVAKDDPELADL